ncbi:MAG: hypothetical protein RTU30_13975 [Candidatus Thorarchaeota archaeon]
MLRKQRVEGNAWYNAITCAPFIIIILLASMWAIAAVGDDAGAVIAFPLFIVFGLFYLWIPSKIFKWWYLQIDENGILYNIFFVKRVYGWDEIVEVTTEQSPEFSGTYDDNLVVKTKNARLNFFLPDFGLHSKRAATRYTEQVTELWEGAKKRGE